VVARVDLPAELTTRSVTPGPDSDVEPEIGPTSEIEHESEHGHEIVHEIEHEPEPEDTLAAEPVAAAPASGTDALPAYTASGYTRRVRGAHTPRTNVVVTRATTDEDDDGAGATRAEVIRDLLSGLESGAARFHAGEGSEPDQ
jgi:hypothetical protein